MASQAQTQFFLKESEINCHVFSQDLRLATWWCPLSRAQKEKYLEQTKSLEKTLVQQYNSIK